MSRLIAVAVLFASFASLSAQDAQVIEAKGYIIPVNRVQVSARVPGVVSEILVREGEVVRKGDAIVRLDATAFQIDLQRAEANLQASEAKLRQILDSGNKVANPDQILAKAGLTKAQADRDMARYRLDATTIRSPIDGTLILVTPNVGDSLRGDGPAANPVCMICNLLELDVEVDIDEKSIRLIEVSSCFALFWMTQLIDTEGESTCSLIPDGSELVRNRIDSPLPPYLNKRFILVSVHVTTIRKVRNTKSGNPVKFGFTPIPR